VRGLRQVDVSNTRDQENRRLTMLRREAGQTQTRIINKIKHILRRHNLQWEMPTKTFPTRMAIAWLKGLALPEIERLELDHLLVEIERIQGWMAKLEMVLVRRCDSSETALLLATTPGVGRFTATALACRIGRVQRFPRARSLANYWGLTPGCRNSGESGQRLGHITKAGSGMARWLLAQLVYKVLRKDRELRQWYKRIKRRRGVGIARVAVMRKLATIFWHMVAAVGHNRMPVLLVNEDQYSLWLNPDIVEREPLEDLFRPADPASMESYATD
jgi:transposase